MRIRKAWHYACNPHALDQACPAEENQYHKDQQARRGQSEDVAIVFHVAEHIVDLNRLADDVGGRPVLIGQLADPGDGVGAGMRILAVLLAGPGSDFMRGAVVRVDGGICRS